MRRNQDRIEQVRAMLAREYPDHDLDADVGDTTPDPGRAERVEVSLIDCLADLRHLAFVSGVDWEKVNEMACKHFREEIDDGATLEGWEEERRRRRPGPGQEGAVGT